jgi:nucleoside-diphosphate-sugar epimerase
MPTPILVTGAAGFIGHAVAHRLLARGERVIGVDIVNDYYDPALKEARLATFAGINSFAFERLDIADADSMRALVHDNHILRVVHLAAQAGVRYSIENPFAGMPRALSTWSMPRRARSMVISPWAAKALRRMNPPTILYRSTPRPNARVS